MPDLERVLEECKEECPTSAEGGQPNEAQCAVNNGIVTTLLLKGVAPKIENVLLNRIESHIKAYQIVTQKGLTGDPTALAAYIQSLLGKGFVNRILDMFVARKSNSKIDLFFLNTLIETLEEDDLKELVEAICIAADPSKVDEIRKTVESIALKKLLTDPTDADLKTPSGDIQIGAKPYSGTAAAIADIIKG